MKVLGRAKLNPYLRVAGRRPDGYHDLETVMQSVDLADEVHLEPAGSTGVEIVWAPGLSGPLPEPPDIVARVLAAAGIAARARVVKRIPIGAGLGGGSADAAAALLGAAALGASIDPGKVAPTLGSDVAFCLVGGTAVAHGRGEVLSGLSCPAPLWWVIGIPSFRLSTADVYRRHDEIGGAGGGPPVGSIGSALEGGRVGEVAGLFWNDLEAAAVDLAPGIAGLKQAMRGAGALGAVMSGSGSAIAGLCRDRSHAERVAAGCAPSFQRMVIAGSTSAGAEIVS